MNIQNVGRPSTLGESLLLESRRAESIFRECLPTRSGTFLSLRRSALVRSRIVVFALTVPLSGVTYGSFVAAPVVDYASNVWMHACKTVIHDVARAVEKDSLSNHGLQRLARYSKKRSLVACSLWLVVTVPSALVS
ncbi:ATP-dependent DNA helicase PIF1 [Fusarium oxysporum f. sp. albedinis]|nr:ATP-dependent DNA helicase PIF1 [Fusarium oxysporum f. sp. albedinis]